MSASEQNVVYNFLCRLSSRNIEEGDLSKLMHIQISLNSLIKKLEPIKSWGELNKSSQNDTERRETEKEIEDLESQIELKTEEYSNLLKKMFPHGK